MWAYKNKKSRMLPFLNKWLLMIVLCLNHCLIKKRNWFKCKQVYSQITVSDDKYNKNEELF